MVELKVVYCDICKKRIECDNSKVEAMQVLIRKGNAEATYDCCSDSCAKQLFGELELHWLRDN